MPVQLVSIDAVTALSGVKCCVYGKPGVGKTRLIATAPRPVVISTEGGLLSLKGRNLPAILVKDMQGLYEALQWALSSQEAKQFHTVCLDSISDLAEVILNDELKRNKDGRAAYRETGDKVMSMFRAFRDLPNKHVYFVAKEEWDKDDANGGMWFRPAMPGKQLSGQLPYFFDEVFQLVNIRQPDGTLVEALRTRSDNSNVAKDRSGKLAEWEQPNLSAIFAKILA